MKSFTFARNARTTLYEVHAARCKHLMAAHLETFSTVEAENGAAAAAAFETQNDDVLCKLGPCARV